MICQKLLVNLNFYHLRKNNIWIFYQLTRIQSSGRNLDEKIDNMSKYSLINNGNIDGDPYRAYLSSNLSFGNNLESFGAYTLI